DDGGGDHLALRRFDEDEVVFHFDRDASVSARNHVDPVRQFLCGDRGRRRQFTTSGAEALGCSAPSFGSGAPATSTAGGGSRWRGSWRVGLHVGHGYIRPRETSASLNDLRGKFHAAEILVSAVALFDEHVADDVVFDFGF